MRTFDLSTKCCTWYIAVIFIIDLPCEEDEFQCLIGGHFFSCVIILHNAPLMDLMNKTVQVSLYITTRSENLNQLARIIINCHNTILVTALICHTKHPYSSDSGGDWFAPDGTVVSGDNVPGLTTYELPIALRLFRNAVSDPAPKGIYQCVVVSFF